MSKQEVDTRKMKTIAVITSEFESKQLIFRVSNE